MQLPLVSSCCLMTAIIPVMYLYCRFFSPYSWTNNDTYKPTRNTTWKVAFIIVLHKFTICTSFKYICIQTHHLWFWIIIIIFVVYTVLVQFINNNSFTENITVDTVTKYIENSETLHLADFLMMKKSLVLLCCVWVSIARCLHFMHWKLQTFYIFRSFLKGFLLYLIVGTYVQFTQKEKCKKSYALDIMAHVAWVLLVPYCRQIP